MDTLTLKKKALFATIIRILTIAQLAQADIDNDSWQSFMLWNPSDSQLHREQDGSIIIYHGLTDKTVENVMDRQFDRLSSMMFTGVVITDQSGEAMIDPDTNEVVVEDDGCD